MFVTVDVGDVAQEEAEKIVIKVEAAASKVARQRAPEASLVPSLLGGSGSGLIISTSSALSSFMSSSSMAWFSSGGAPRSSRRASKLRAVGAKMQTGKDQWSQVTTNGWHEFFTYGSQHAEHKHKCISTAFANCHMHPLSTQLEFSYPHDVVQKSSHSIFLCLWKRSLCILL